jgi:hypothetical protein
MEFNFIVAGLKYSTKKLPAEFRIGTLVELDQDITNPFDEDAISVWVGGEKIGYVPNTGEFCSVCLEKIKKGQWYCKCGADSEKFIEGGIASKINASGILQREYAAFVNRVFDKKILIKLLEVGEELE